MTKNSAPFSTSPPGVKLMLCRKPCTRARTSTASTDAVWPVNSEYVVTSRWTGCATVTSCGGGRGTRAGVQHAAPPRAAAHLVFRRIRHEVLPVAQLPAAAERLVQRDHLERHGPARRGERVVLVQLRLLRRQNAGVVGGAL